MTTRSPLSPEAAALQQERLGRVKIDNERRWIEQLVGSNADRVTLDSVIEAAGRLWAFTLRFDVRTCIRRVDEDPVFARKAVEASFSLGGYPFTAPQVVIQCESPLFLPGALHVATHAAPCLYRGNYDSKRMDLPFFVTQTWRALTVVPAVLNSVDDALNADAALWFIRRRDELELPLDAPLIEPRRSADGDARETTRAFVLRPMR